MKISLAKHGGQTAGMFLGRPPRVLDTNTLPSPAAEELAKLVEAAKAAAPAAGTGPRRARDMMSYTIIVEDSGHQTVLKQSDTTMSPAFRNLLAWLERHMK
jgi:hypothetical protein